MATMAMSFSFTGILKTTEEYELVYSTNWYHQVTFFQIKFLLYHQIGL